MKKFVQFINEGSDLRCSNCGDNLGKATENSKKAYCGTCGSTTHNPAGSDESYDPVPKTNVSTDGYPNIKMTKHKSDITPSGKSFKLDKSNLLKQVGHGNGIYTVTPPYKSHEQYDHLGVKVAKTSIKKINSDGFQSEIGSIDHVKHPDGTETHTLTYRPSNHSWSGGEVKSLKDAVSKTSNIHVLHLKKTGYYDKDKTDHGHDVEFSSK